MRSTVVQPKKRLADKDENVLENDDKFNGEYDASLEMSAQKPIMFNRFSIKSKGNLEHESFLRE